MNKKNKRTILLLLMAIMITIIVTALAAYAYMKVSTYENGNYQIDVKTKGVDYLTMNSESANFRVDKTNFYQKDGHDVSASAKININLFTTNDYSKHCYVMSIDLPKKQVFSYSDGHTPELLLNVEKSTDGIDYSNVLSKYDITTKTGLLYISNDNTKYMIGASKNQNVTDYWKATITFVFLKNIDQGINNYKTYAANFKANIVEC